MLKKMQQTLNHHLKRSLKMNEKKKILAHEGIVTH